MLYPLFSYGINTNINSVQRRCPNWAGAWEPAVLPGWKMTFSKVFGDAGISYCNIEPAPGEKVFGVLLWVDSRSLSHIDRFEGFPIHYDRQSVAVDAEGGRTIQAQAYVSDHTDHTRRPTDDYLDGVLEGLARFAQAPDHYLERVVRIGRPARKTRARARV
jgi:gamma-glutamylcyclotransferase